MPHVITKASAEGSVGDLSRITEALEGLEVNILAIGGGEGVIEGHEVGVVSMILDPEDEATRTAVEDAIRAVDRGPGRAPFDVEQLANVQVELANRVGALKAAADAIGDLNIRSIVMMGFGVGGAIHVGLGFAEGDAGTAVQRLTGAGIAVIPFEEG